MIPAFSHGSQADKLVVVMLRNRRYRSICFCLAGMVAHGQPCFVALRKAHEEVQRNMMGADKNQRQWLPTGNHAL